MQASGISYYSGLQAAQNGHHSAARSVFRYAASPCVSFPIQRRVHTLVSNIRMVPAFPYRFLQQAVVHSTSLHLVMLLIILYRFRSSCDSSFHCNLIYKNRYTFLYHSLVHPLRNSSLDPFLRIHLTIPERNQRASKLLLSSYSHHVS